MKKILFTLAALMLLSVTSCSPPVGSGKGSSGSGAGSGAHGSSGGTGSGSGQTGSTSNQAQSGSTENSSGKGSSGSGAGSSIGGSSNAQSSGGTGSVNGQAQSGSTGNSSGNDSSGSGAGSSVGGSSNAQSSGETGSGSGQTGSTSNQAQSGSTGNSSGNNQSQEGKTQKKKKHGAATSRVSEEEKAKIKAELHAALDKVQAAVGLAYITMTELPASPAVKEFRTIADKYRRPLETTYDEIRNCKLVAAYNRAVQSQDSNLLECRALLTKVKALIDEF